MATTFNGSTQFMGIDFNNDTSADWSIQTSSNSALTWDDLQTGTQQIRTYNGGVTIQQGNSNSWGSLTTTSGTSTWGNTVTLGNFIDETEDLKEFISFLKKYFDKLPFTYEEFMEMDESKRKSILRDSSC